jgi:hypothetical protein
MCACGRPLAIGFTVATGAVAAANVFLFIQPAEKVEGDLRAAEVQEAGAA